MLLGGVLKLLGRRDRRTLRLFRLVVLGLGRLLVAFFVLLAFVAFGLVLGVLVSLVRLRGLDRLTLFTLFRVAVCGGLLGLGLTLVQRLGDRVVARLGLLVGRGGAARNVLIDNRAVLRRFRLFLHIIPPLVLLYRPCPSNTHEMAAC